MGRFCNSDISMMENVSLEMLSLVLKSQRKGTMPKNVAQLIQQKTIRKVPDRLTAKHSVLTKAGVLSVFGRRMKYVRLCKQLQP